MEKIYMRFTMKALILALSLVLSTSLAAFAQGSFGELRGTVVDSAGAAISGATVVVTNQATNEARTVTTNEDGQFAVSNLVVGSYTVAVSSSGFANSTVKDVRISVAFKTEQNVTLNPAGSSETVTVTSGDSSTQINTNDQQLSTIIGNKKIQDLPLLSRDPSSLVLLAPGTVQTDSGLGGFSVNGSRERNNNFMVDGVDNNDTDVPGIPGGVATPNIDATEEFRVITLNPTAEYGRNTGGTITTATKRGTNDFHGNLYEYWRSDQFSARNFFDTTGSSDPLKRHQYGGSFGGRLIKDKLFFFGNYEANRSRSGSPQFRAVPTAGARTGVFTTPQFGTVDIRPGGPNNGTDDILGIALPWNPAMVAILNTIYPLPNYPVNGARAAPAPGAIEWYQFGYVAKDKVDQFATRFDWRINDSHTLTFSANYGKGDYALFPPTFDTFDDESRTPQLGGVFSLNFLSNITASFVNELRLGTNRVDAQFNGPGSTGVSNELNDRVRSIFGMNGLQYPTFGGANGGNLNLFTGFTSISNFDSQGRKTGTTTIGDTLTWVKGNHILKFGGEGRLVYSNGESNFSRAESLDLSITPTFGPGAGLAVDAAGNPLGYDPVNGVQAIPAGEVISNYLSFLTGFVASQSQVQFFDKTGQRVTNDYRRYRTNEYGFFVQDAWRVRPNLTINLGLRYEYNTVPYEKNGLLSNLVDQDPSLATPAGGFVFKTVGKNSDNPGLQLYDDDWNNWGPRVGFAWSPGFEKGILGKVFGGPGKSSIRGGFGVFYDRVFTNLFSNTSSNLPFSATIVNFPIDNYPDVTINVVPRIPTATATSAQLEGDEGSAVIFPTSQNNIFQDKFVIPSSNAWSLGFERDLGGNFSFEANYVGTKGIHLIRDLNAQLTSVRRVNAIRGTNVAVSPNLRTNWTNGSLNTAFGQSSAFLITSIGNSEYNAMQLRLTKTLTNRKFGEGQFQVFYTLSHSIDDAPDALVVGTSDRSLPRDSSGYSGGLRAERGDSSFDARHVISGNFIYEFPFFRGHSWKERLLGNWVISGIVRHQTGYPFSVFQNGVDRQGTGLSARATYAADGTVAYTSTQTPDNTRIYTGPNRTLFSRIHPIDGNQGSVGRGVFRGPAFSSTDISLIKRFPINENMRFTIRADFFNIFNNVNLGVPVADVTQDNFGVSTFAGRPRIIQFAGRFDF